MGEKQALRPYQEAARKSIHTEWENGRLRTLLVLPTGTGKTIVFASVAADQVRAGDRVLILAHRGELLEQAADKLQRSTGLVSAVEKAESTCLDSWYRVVVGSVQTLQRPARLERFPRDYFGTIIIDEAHHAITDGYRRILDYFEGAKVLGVTATPDRGDMRNLGEVFDSLSYEYKLTDAIKDGYLCRIMAQTIPLKLDISAVGMSSGDYSVGELGTALDPYLSQIADEMAARCAGRKTVVFLPLIKTSQKFRDLLNAKGFCAAEVNGQSADRRQVLSDFEADKYNVLCNSMLLTEGWDCPSVDCVVVLRPTKVRSLYSQMVGRGTRLSPGKKDLLLLDFLWMTDKHELCRPADLVCEDRAVARQMTDNLAESGGPQDTSPSSRLWTGIRKYRWSGMNDFHFELNREGVRTLMRSPEMQAVLKDRADTVKGRCGDGYDSYVAQTRAVAVVETATPEAYNDNSANNTLLKAVSSSRTGAVVHEHKRHLKDGRVITVRSYQRKK